MVDLKLPWSHSNGNVLSSHGREVEANGFSTVMAHSEKQADARARAAFIVTSANAHAALLEALTECEEYFDNRADADCDQDGFIPNKEMELLHVVRTALKKAGVQ